MKKYENFEPLFPPQFSEFEEPVRDAQFRILKIDEEISQLPRNNFFRFELNPPGYKRPTNETDKRKQEFIERKENIRAKLKAEIDQQLKHIDPLTAKRVRDTVEANICESEYNKLDRWGIKDNAKHIKTMEQSSNFISKMLSDEKADYGYKEQARKSGVEKFLSSLKSKQATSKEDKEISKTHIEPDKT